MSSIRISEENATKIIELKQKHSYKNANDVITQLLTVYEKYEKSRIVRLVE